MWGSYLTMQHAKDFIQLKLLEARNTVGNLVKLSYKINPSKLAVAVHIRLGDFYPSLPLHSSQHYKGALNVSLPLEWYMGICSKLQQHFGNRIQFMLFSDATIEQLAPFILEFQPVHTLNESHTDCSDLLAMAKAHVLICSVSTYSLLAAFLSNGPYLWFKNQLLEHDGDFYSLLNEETTQEDFYLLSGQITRELPNFGLPRGIPIGADCMLPAGLFRYLELRADMQDQRRDLIYFGLAPGSTL